MSLAPTERFERRLDAAFRFHVQEYRLDQPYAVDLLAAVQDLGQRLKALPAADDPVTPIVAVWLNEQLPATTMEAERGLLLHVAHLARGLWIGAMSSVDLQEALSAEARGHTPFHEESDESLAYGQQTVDELADADDLEPYLADLAAIQRDWDEHGATDEHSVHYLIHERVLGVACALTGSHIREPLADPVETALLAVTPPAAVEDLAATA